MSTADDDSSNRRAAACSVPGFEEMRSGYLAVFNCGTWLLAKAPQPLGKGFCHELYTLH